MSTEQMGAVKNDVLHVPTVLGADVLTYNLPAIGSSKLVLDGDAIAGIFLGRITKWNDPKLAALNAGLKLPNTDIIVVHRSDGSGTSFIFTDYLSKVSPEWKAKVGAATSVNWPIGLGGKGNEGVTQQVKQTEGAIGYVELIYAASNGLAFADIKNAAGKAVTPNLASVTAAAQSANFTPDTDFRVSITNAPGRRCLPHRVVHLAPDQAVQSGPGQVQADQGLHQLDAVPGGPADGGRSPVRAAPGSAHRTDPEAGGHLTHPLDRASLRVRYMSVTE